MAYKSVLLIDDDEDDQDIFLSAIKTISCSIDCMAISNASEALHKLASGTVQPDVIFLDLNMPVMTGQQFLEAVKKEQEVSGIPIIIFSTTSDKGTIERTKALGAADFITKPNKFDDLVSILNHAVC